MTTFPPATARTLTLSPLLAAAALLLTGCMAPPETPILDSSLDPSVTEELDAPDSAPVAGEEICEIKSEWDRIDALLVAAGRENPPAPTYTDAMLQLQAVIPPESIKADWLELRTLVEAYAPVIGRGDSAEIADQADEVIAIAAVQLRLFSLFQANCA